MYQDIMRESQLTSTLKLAAEIADREAALARWYSEPPRAGDTFLSRRTAEYPVEWLVVDEAEGRVQVVPLDAHPFVGSRDLVLPERLPGDTAVLRCDLDAWLDASELEPELRTGTLSASQVEDVRQKRQAIDEQSIRATLLEEEVDGDPEYRHWRESTLRPALAALQGLDESEEAVSSEVPPTSESQLRRWWPMLVAASLLTAVALPLGWQVQRFRGQLEDERTRVAEANRHLAESESKVGRLESALDTLRKTTEQALAQQKEEIEQRLRRALDRSVVVNVPSFVLSRAERERARRGLAEPIDPGGAPRFTLSLEVPDPAPYRAYRLRVVEKASGREVWSHDGLVKVSGKWLRLDLPADLFEPVEHELLIYGLGSGPPKLLDERYAVKLKK